MQNFTLPEQSKNYFEFYFAVKSVRGRRTVEKGEQNITPCARDQALRRSQGWRMRSRRSSSGAGVVSERRMPQLYSACNRHILVALLLRSPSYPPVNQSERYAAMTSPPVARARLGGKGGQPLPFHPRTSRCHQLLFTCCGLGGDGSGKGGRLRDGGRHGAAPVFENILFLYFVFFLSEMKGGLYFCSGSHSGERRCDVKITEFSNDTEGE
ncbi:hypothetical protein NPIL_639501 [Nephila pilipes]|uniref:Uncharacterized protein n=1 Tax=Nephila pilipes TaxID=299642 RepID=A0A8X6Q0I8_NEPPI|nr:hypothetical protein NPIL_639501 [Nephila pilipes]